LDDVPSSDHGHVCAHDAPAIVHSTPNLRLTADAGRFAIDERDIYGHHIVAQRKDLAARDATRLRDRVRIASPGSDRLNPELKLIDTEADNRAIIPKDGVHRIHPIVEKVSLVLLIQLGHFVDRLAVLSVADRHR
jgi:hypothetical protein